MGEPAGPLSSPLRESCLSQVLQPSPPRGPALEPAPSSLSLSLQQKQSTAFNGPGQIGKQAPSPNYLPGSSCFSHPQETKVHGTGGPHASLTTQADTTKATNTRKVMLLSVPGCWGSRGGPGRLWAWVAGSESGGGKQRWRNDFPLRHKHTLASHSSPFPERRQPISPLSRDPPRPFAPDVAIEGDGRCQHSKFNSPFNCSKLY